MTTPSFEPSSGPGAPGPAVLPQPVGTDSGAPGQPIARDTPGAAVPNARGAAGTTNPVRGPFGANAATTASATGGVNVPNAAGNGGSFPANGADPAAGASDTRTPALVSVPEITASNSGPRAEADEETLRTHLATAVAAYRRAVLATDPDLPDELVAGSTVAEVDAAVERARSVVARLKEQIRTNDAQRVPAGSTGRTPLDPASLSPREKIVLGMQRPV